MPTRRFTFREEIRRAAGLERPEVLCIRGRLQPDLHFVPIRCYSTTFVRRWPEATKATLKLLNATGEVVNTGPVSLVLPPDHEDSVPYEKATGYVALRNGADSVRLTVDGAVAWQREVLGAATLKIRLGRVTRTGKVAVAVRHSKAHDGAHLGVVLQWGKRKFRTVGVFEPSDRLELDLSEFPGSARSTLAIHYSNGMRSASAETASFALAPLAPEISIEDPALGARRSPFAPLDLMASVVDHQSNKVIEDNIEWLIDGEVVAHGRVLTVEVRYNPPDERKAVADACRISIARPGRNAPAPGCEWDDHDLG